MQTTGLVSKIFFKEFPGNNGKPPNKSFTIKLERDEVYYRCGQSDPGNIEGQKVTLTHDPVTFTKKGEKEAKVTARPEVISQKSEPSTGQTSTTSAQSSYSMASSARESSIHYQSARKDALQMVDIVTRTGAIKLPAKEANKLEAVEALVDSYTARFFEDISTFGAVARANGTDEPEGEGKPDSDDEEE